MAADKHTLLVNQKEQVAMKRHCYVTQLMLTPSAQFGSPAGLRRTLL